MRSILKIIILSSFLLTVLLVKRESTRQVFAQPNSIEIAIIGDFGADSKPQSDVAALIDSWSPDYIVTVGDNRYGIADLDIAVGKYYCDYLHGVQPGVHCPSGGNASTNRFFPTVGNHDYSDGNGIGDYLDYFDIPGAGANSSNTSGSELYYDFTLGPIHFISLNSEAIETENSEQAAWARDQLENSTAQFQVVLFHRPPFSSASRGLRGAHMRWPFEAWGADAVITGDDHFYERYAIGDIPYIINGAGGRSLYSFGTIDAASTKRFRDDYGALRITATSTSLKFDYYSRDNVVRDSFELPQKFDACRTASYPAFEDTWINAERPDKNYQNETGLLFDGLPDHGTLLRWDIATIPEGAELQSPPILTLDYYDHTTSQYEVYAMNRSWTVDYVTWNHYKENVEWVNGAGGFGDRGPLFGITAGQNLSKDNVVFNEAGQQWVQNWLDGTRKNNGIFIANYESASNGGDIFHHPHLTLEYCWVKPTSVQMNSAEITPSPAATHLFALLLVLTTGTLSVQLHKRFSAC